MKNISLHAPLNNTNRNWERALIKKANSGSSSLEKGAYAFTIYSVPDEMIAQFPNPPELIATDTPEYSLYHLDSIAGLVVLHNYNDLTLGISIRNTGDSYVKLGSIFTFDNDGGYVLGLLDDVSFIGEGSHWHAGDGDEVPYIYIQNDALNETLYAAISEFLDYEFPLES